jgi:hypothetical protein
MRNMPAGGSAAKRKRMIRAGYEIEDRQSEADNRHNQKECTHRISLQSRRLVSRDAMHISRQARLISKTGLAPYWTAHGRVNQPRASGKKKKNEISPTPIE